MKILRLSYSEKHPHGSSHQKVAVLKRNMNDTFSLRLKYGENETNLTLWEHCGTF